MKTPTGYELTAKRVRLYNIGAIIACTTILYQTGKDMAKRYGLHHWDRPWLITLAAFVLGVIKHPAFAFLNAEKKIVATLQMRIEGDILWTIKLGVLASEKGNAIGGVCMQYCEDEGKKNGCTTAQGIVYAKAEHSLAFHRKRGYTVYDDVRDHSDKYELVRIEKPL